jgi:branched-chain amino acid transport system substrate-binding protein
MSFKRRGAAITAALVSVAGLTTACGSSDGSSSGACEITLGAIGPLTGPGASFGIPLKNTATFIAEQTNADGGLKVGDKTCKVAVKTYDTKYASAGAAAGLNSFAADGIKFIIGPAGTIELDGMKPIADRNKMLMVFSGYGAKDLDPKYPLNFHVAPGPSLWSETIAGEAKKVYGFESATLIGPNDASGLPTLNANEKAFEANGVSVKIETYQRGSSDFSALVQRVLRTKSDTIDFAGTPAGDAGVIAKELRQGGFTGSFARLGGESTAEIARAAGGVEVLGDFWYYASIDPNDAKTKELIAEYKSVLGSDPTPLSIAYTPAARALMRAISAAGTTDDTAAVASELRKDSLQDPTFGQGEFTGEEQFGINQEFAFPFYMGRIKDGAYLPFTKLAAGS